MGNNGSNEISPNIDQGKRNGRSLGSLRTVALIMLVIGCAGSLAFMFREGQQTPRFLLVLFTIWVLSPFVILFWANTVSKRWSVATQAALYCVMFIVALSSLAIYGEWIDIRPAGSANAFPFVIVPPISVLFIAIVVLMAAFLSGKLSRRGDDN